MLYTIVSKIYIDRRFLKDGCYSQQIITDIVKESLIPYDHTQRVPETQTSNTVMPNSTPNQVKQM